MIGKRNTNQGENPAVVLQSHTEPLCQEAERQHKGAWKRAGEEDQGIWLSPGPLQAPRELQPPDGLGKGKTKSLKKSAGICFCCLFPDKAAFGNIYALGAGQSLIKSPTSFPP